jgi:hypothetical protein
MRLHCDTKEIKINAQIKNSIKKLLNFVGIASASVFLTFPAFASNISNANDLNPTYSNRARSADSTANLGELSDRNRAEKKKCCQHKTYTGYRKTPTTGGGYRGINWVCLNNPNSKCRS